MEQAAKTIENIDIGLLDLKKAEFYVTAGGFAGLKYNGTDYAHITLKRALPSAMPFEYISVSDAENKEIGILRSIAELSPSQREIVVKELGNRYYTPEVLEVKSVKDKLGYIYIELRLKGGGKEHTKSCAVKDVNRNIRMMGEDSLIIFDVDGNRYLVKSVAGLDKNSVRRLEPFMF